MKSIRAYLLETVLAIASLCLILLLVMPYWFGISMQSDYEEAIRRFSASSDLSYEVVSYNKHWFTTDADLLIKDKNNQSLFYLRQQIIHGPLYLGLILQGSSPWVSMVIKGAVLPAEKTQNVLTGLFAPESAMSLVAAIRFNKDAVVRFIVPAVNSFVDGVNYKTEGLDIKFEYFSKDSRFQGELNMPALSIHDHSLFEIERFLLSFDQDCSGEACSGDLVLSFDAFKLKLSDEIIDIRQLSSRIRNKNKLSELSVSVDINASKINLFNEQINGLSISMGIDKISTKEFLGDFESFVKNKQAVSQSFRFSSYRYENIKVKPFSFFSEYGAFSADFSLSNMSDKAFSITKNFSKNNPVVNMSVSSGLFKRIFELFSTNLEYPVQDSGVFVNKLIDFNYLDNNQDGLQLSLSSMDGDIVINDVLVNYDDLSNNFLSAVFLK